MLAKWYFTVAAVCWVVAWLSSDSDPMTFWRIVFVVTIVGAIVSTFVAVVLTGLYLMEKEG